MDRSTVQDWLDRYVAAWKSYDAEEIAALFADDATYRYHPYDEGESVVRGRAAIVKDWIEPDGNASSRDDEGTYDAQYEPFAVEADRAVAVGTSSYYTDASKSTLERVFHNAYLLRFDGDGRCTEFTEFFMQAPAPNERGG
jgi:ketosteroid isomerase-like protein